MIYGVQARKGPDDVDCAQEAKPISEIERFASEVSTATGQLLQPRHEGIEVGAIRSLRHPNAGYLVILVQRSERRPHRSEAKDQKQYFKRAGDSSFEMEHYDIEDAFRRISAANLELMWSISQGAIVGGIPQFYVELSLINTSTITAKFPYLQISQFRGEPQDRRLFSLPLTSYPSHQDGPWTVYAAGSDVVINPGLKSPVVRKSIDVEKNHNEYSVRGRYSGPLFEFRYRMGCEDSRMAEGKIAVSLEEANADL